MAFREDLVTTCPDEHALRNGVRDVDEENASRDEGVERHRASHIDEAIENSEDTCKHGGLHRNFQLAIDMAEVGRKGHAVVSGEGPDQPASSDDDPGDAADVDHDEPDHEEQRRARVVDGLS